MRSCTRRIEFDAAHRVMRHESKCAHLHGHRYVVEITVAAHELDSVGRVVDFGVVKEIVGKWIDDNLDHGTLVNAKDGALRYFLHDNNQKRYVLDENPTAENIAKLLHDVASRLLPSFTVTRVVVYETPNCWSEYP